MYIYIYTHTHTRYKKINKLQIKTNITSTMKGELVYTIISIVYTSSVLKYLLHFDFWHYLSFKLILYIATNVSKSIVK